ncbi:MAG: hypothetical protein V4635_02515 [Bacteroidota bacterium]
MSNLKHIARTLVVANIILLFTACGSSGTGGKDEGVIEFDTKGVDEKHPLYGLAPSSATLKFKGDKFAIEMSTMGMFNTAIIGDAKAKTITQTVKFLDIKQACIQNENDIKADNLDFALKLDETGETKKIINLKCYKVHATKVNEPNVSFDVWYTKELGMENCNALTPYAQLKGVLLDYRVKKLGLEMHFLAKHYEQALVPDNTFEIPPSMKIISQEEMAKFFANY